VASRRIGAGTPASGRNPERPRRILAAIENSPSRRVGACGDMALRLKESTKPLDAIRELGSRLRVLHLADRTALGPSGRSIALGRGIAEIPAVLDDMYRLDVKPTLIAVEPSGADEVFGGFSRSLQAFEKAVQLVLADRVAQLSRTVPIKGPERLSPAVREKVASAIPARPAVQPKKPRRLLVFDLEVGYGGLNGGHHHATRHPAVHRQIRDQGCQLRADVSRGFLRHLRSRALATLWADHAIALIFDDPRLNRRQLRHLMPLHAAYGLHLPPPARATDARIVGTVPAPRAESR
jgi:hypothetical protein